MIGQGRSEQVHVGRQCHESRCLPSELQGRIRSPRQQQVQFDALGAGFQFPIDRTATKPEFGGFQDPDLQLRGDPGRIALDQYLPQRTEPIGHLARHPRLFGRAGHGQGQLACAFTQCLTKPFQPEARQCDILIGDRLAQGQSPGPFKDQTDIDLSTGANAGKASVRLQFTKPTTADFTGIFAVSGIEMAPNP